jgi:DNA-binding NarL/FixJ family response regulator
MESVRILLIDDHTLFRSGLRMVLNALMPEVSVFDVESLSEAQQVSSTSFEVILLDITMPGLNGVEGIALLKRRWPQAHILMLSAQDDAEVRRFALARGAEDFISKTTSAENIVSIIKRTLQGKNLATCESNASSSILNEQHLTPRQCEVLVLVCHGMSNKLIARELSLSENTVRGHVQAILEFLQVSSRLEAAFEARRRGLVN